MPANSSSDSLFQALQEAGISKAYVRRMLPDWWTEELINDPAARVELDINLSRMFGLRLSSLLQDRPIITLDLPGGAKFKRARTIGEGELAQATSIVHSIAKMVASAVTVEFNPIDSDPLAIRSEILRKFPNRVSLMATIDYLWNHGIPTIHLSELPEGLRKMDGLALRVGDRPVIVLCKQSPFQAWHLFIVAHELAHCSLGHIGNDEVLVDCTLGEESYLLGESDPDEIAADELAITLLNGAPGVTYISNGTANSAQLAQAAIAYQDDNQVDAGHVILNFANRNKQWAVAQAALRRLDQGNAPKRINQYLFDHLDLDWLPESSVEYLAKVTGIDAGSQGAGGFK